MKSETLAQDEPHLKATKSGTRPETITVSECEHEVMVHESNQRSEKKSKIGTYTSAEFQNWLTTPIQKTKIKRSKRMNDEAYQIFQDFSEKIESQEWKAFFQKLYTGKFPHGYSFRNQTLFFRKRTKIEKLDITDASNDTLNKVMHFFEMYGGFTDSSDNLNIFDYLVSEIEPYRSWKEIRSKKTKQFFIQNYVDDLGDKYKLNNQEKKYLLDTIHTGFLIRAIDSGDIDFENKKITNIKTLVWNDESRTFDLIENMKHQRISRKNTCEKTSKSSYSAHWSKFLSYIVKDKIIIDDISTDASIMVEDFTDTTVSFSITE